MDSCFYFKSGKLRQVIILLPLCLFVFSPAMAQVQPREKSLDLYGYIMTDIGYNFNQIDPIWFDILRVTGLPQYKDQFAPDGKIFFSVRQTRLGIKNLSQTPLGPLKINFEFDLFGLGPDVGQTTFHFRSAHAELGRFTFGQALSVFADIEVSPSILDFGAPPSRTSLWTILVRYMNTREHSRWAVALEKPGATSDEGIYADRIELQNVKAEFKVPDLSAEYRQIMTGGYIELAGVVKWIRWEDTGNAPVDLSGDEVGWGFNISSIQRLSPQTLFKGQFVYGKGIESHLTDAAFDVGIKNNFQDPSKPVLGVALPVIGGLAFLEHRWTGRWSSTMGYSRVHIYNSDAQADNAFSDGNYAIVNLLHQPFPQFLAGAELQWGKRNNFRDGFSSSAFRVQFSFKYNIFLHLVSSENQ